MLAQRPHTNGRAGVSHDGVVLVGGMAAVRRAVLSRLAGPDAAVIRCDGDPLRLDEAGMLVVDGVPRWEAGVVEQVDAWVRGGGRLLVLATDPLAPGHPLAALTGAAADKAMPEGEVVAVCVPGSARTRRIDPEFALTEGVRPLRLLAPDAAPLVTVHESSRKRPAVVERTLGRGRVTISGLGSGTDPLATGPLAAVLRRALRPEPAAHEVPLGVGIVGYGPFGGMGHLHGRAAAEVEGLRLVAVCDSAPERLAAALGEFPGCRPHADAAGVAGDREVDIAIVATPPVHHAELVLMMLRAGKHVVCEKPLCLTTDEVDVLVEAARAAGVSLTVHQNRRWDGDFLALQDAVASGLAGAVFNVETFVGGFEHPCRAWHGDAEVSGGAVYDWGSHHIDWILALMGEDPASVSMVEHKRVWHDVSNSDQLRLRLAWADGREAQFLQSDVLAVRPPKFLVQGTKGTIAGWYRPIVAERVEPGRGHVRETFHHAEAPVDLHVHRHRAGGGLVESIVPPLPSPAHAFHRNLADHLHLGEPQAVTPASVRRVIEVLESATRSADRGGAPVALSGE